jgi:hypothetical protein
MKGYIMRYLFLAITIVLLSSCSTTHHHHYDNEDKQMIAHPKILDHEYIDKGDYIVVIIKHKPKLSKQDRKRIKHWCRKHYGSHNKKMRFKFNVIK